MRIVPSEPENDLLEQVYPTLVGTAWQRRVMQDNRGVIVMVHSSLSISNPRIVIRSFDVFIRPG